MGVVARAMAIFRRLQHRQGVALTRGERVLLFAGIFFTFSAVGWMLTPLISEPMLGLGGGIYTAIITGGFGCLWAYCFISRRYWLLAVVAPLNMVAPWLLADHVVPKELFALGIERSVRHKSAVFSVAAIISLVIGYICGVQFTGRIERRTVRAQAELDVAKRVHESIVPDVEIKAAGVEVYGRSHASSEMGGDLIDVVVRGDEVDVYLADVSGHGVGAGIVMAMVKSAIRTRLRQSAALPDLLTDLNAVLGELMKPGMFATMACVRLRREAGAMRAEYALAGHLPILLKPAAQSRVVDLPNERLPLGVSEEERFVSGGVTLSPGDMLLLFTDGLIEVQNSAGR